ncbi:MAG: protein-export chaperone SecB [Patescibacteria group bacterium]
MNRVFRLDRYQIESVAVVLNESYDAKLPSHAGDVSVKMTIAPHKEDPTRYLLSLELFVRPKKDHEKAFFPYNIAIKGRAFFVFKDNCPKDQAKHVLSLNGASILHGLLRAQVAQITAQSVHGQFLLPTMNFVEMAQSQQAGKPTKASKGKEHAKP